MKKHFNPLWYLAVGVILLAGSHMSYAVDILAWVSLVPFLLYLHKTSGFKSKLWFFLTIFIGWSMSVGKIITDPLSFYFIPLFSIPVSLFHFAGYWLWSGFRERKLAWLLFPSVMVVVEWLQYTFTPFASWGAMAYSQVDNTLLTQSVSLFGLAGLSFLIYLFNVVIATGLIQNRINRVQWVVSFTALLGFLLYGSFRYDFFNAKSHELVKVAAVGTDSMVGGLPLPTDEERKEDIHKLVQRTRQAAKSSPQLIVWNEASLVILPEEEPAWKDSLSVLAREVNAVLVASYVVPHLGENFQFENKFLLYEPDGRLITEYYKEEPTPGEPSVKKENILGYGQIGNALVGGAICYDFDFPHMGRKTSPANIVALPSSDWRGIDPLHTKMAAFRAIEQGNSIVRSTRWGLSAAINPLGEFTARMSSFDHNDKIMIGFLPVGKMFTIYSHIGDLFVMVCIGFVLFEIIKGRISKENIQEEPGGQNPV